MVNIERLTSSEKPPEISRGESSTGALDTTYVCFDVTTSNDSNGNIVYNYSRVELTPKCFSSYDKLVSTLIEIKYPSDKVQAIILNLFDGSTDHVGEFTAMQTWRSTVKQFAKSVFEQYNKSINNSNNEKSTD